VDRSGPINVVDRDGNLFLSVRGFAQSGPPGDSRIREVISLEDMGWKIIFKTSTYHILGNDHLNNSSPNQDFHGTETCIRVI